MAWAFVAIVSVLLLFIAVLIYSLGREDSTSEPTHQIQKLSQREITFTPSHRPTPLSTPAISLFEVEELPQIADVIFSKASESVNLCPSCGRKFNQQIGICPFDSTPLESVPATSKPTSQGNKQCPECDRSFEHPAKYCYVHGAKLQTSTDAIRKYWACQTCGQEGIGESGDCGCSETERIVVNPLDATPLSPTIPLNRCPNCQRLGPQSMRRCPDDGYAMLPVWDLKFRAMPYRGFGPRRAVCDKCGTTYSSASKFCAVDGHELTPLN